MGTGSRLQHDFSFITDYCTQPLQAYWKPESSISASLGRPSSFWRCTEGWHGQKGCRDTWAHVAEFPGLTALCWAPERTLSFVRPPLGSVLRKS